MQNGPSRTDSSADSDFVHLPALVENADQRIHVTVSLPPLAPKTTRLTSVQRTSLRLQQQRAPGSAVRLSAATNASNTSNNNNNITPLPPPRPESTISSWTRDVSSLSVSSTAVPPPAASSRFEVVDTTPFIVTSNHISLNAPRPEPDRVENLYVDAPLKPHDDQHHSKQPLHRSHHLVPTSSSRSPASLNSTVIQLPVSSKKKKSHSSSTLKKKTNTNNNNLSDSNSSSSSSSTSSSDPFDNSFVLDDTSNSNESIICRNCGRCRCLACRTPKKLPEKWICGNKCRLSAESVVDTLSCLCVVKAGLYHCGKDVEESNKAKSGFDSPCSCTADHSCTRWTCLGLTSVVLPCLCCYWPLRGCAKGVETVYRRVKANGCECRESMSNNDKTHDSTTNSEVIIKDQPFSTATSPSPSEKLLLN